LFHGRTTIAFRDTLKALVRDLRRRWATTPQAANDVPRSPAELRPLTRIVLTEEVNRTLFAEYAAHRATERGHEEIGWALLGVRTADEATVMATLPAGEHREAGSAHVRFNPLAQELGTRILRQGNRQLTMLGIVHTHPGSMRHPSDGDYRGDIEWVEGLRGREGVFAIGTADAAGNDSWMSALHVQADGALAFTWYSLQSGARNYQPLPVKNIPGADRAAPLRAVWTELETQAGRLLRLAGQLVRVQFDVIEGSTKAALVCDVPLPDQGRVIRVVMEGKDVRYLLIDGEQVQMAQFRDDRVDRGVFAMLAELCN